MNSDNPPQAYFLSLEKVPTPVWYRLHCRVPHPQAP